jgi:protein-S-isoprenylcysteine O-methyltransferase Ste14
VSGRRGLSRWFASTSNRTFIAWPVVLVALEALVQGGVPRIEWGGFPLLAWGYLQYRLTGNYRARIGGGGPGISVPPERLVTSGPYRVVRNPMYIGHLIFFVGLAIVLRSWIAAAVLGLHLAWFDRRAREDEARLSGIFGESYRQYCRNVKRWVPGIY